MKQNILKIIKSFFLVVLAIIIPLTFIGCGKTPENEEDKIDIDLSKMSTTMSYSYITNMIENPNEFMGKTVKATGTHKTTTSNNITYHAILIYDSTSCCSQALEFILEDGKNYPSTEKEITIEGTFGTYNEGNNTYCYLNPSKVV